MFYPTAMLRGLRLRDEKSPPLFAGLGLKVLLLSNEVIRSSRANGLLTWARALGTML